MTHHTETQKKIEKILWNDSQMYLTQTPSESEWKTCLVESVGFIIEETKEHVVLSGDLIEEDVRRIIVIPKENIKKRTRCGTPR